MKWKTKLYEITRAVVAMHKTTRIYRENKIAWFEKWNKTDFDQGHSHFDMAILQFCNFLYALCRRRQ